MCIPSIHRVFRRTVLTVAAAGLVWMSASMAAGRAQAADANHWSGGFGSARIEGTPLSARAWDGATVVGGDFVAAGGDARCANIALWREGQWQPLGSGFNGAVRGSVAVRVLLVRSWSMVAA